MTQPPKRLPYRAKRLLALMKGKENIDDFPNAETFRLYNIKRDLFITCTQNDISYYLENI